MKLLLLCLLILFTSFKVELDEENDFNKKLSLHRLVLEKPNGFEEVKVNNNTEIGYDFALKHDSINFEVRFLINGINKNLDLPDNERSLSLFTNIVLKASGEVLPNIPKVNILDIYLANKDYNADWLANSTFIADSDFAGGYRYCSTIGIRKDGVSETYIFFLFNDKNEATQLLPKVATCLKFSV